VPTKPAKPKISESLKSTVKSKADDFVESFLKPRFIKPPPKENQGNYAVDIFTKWHQRYFYFCSTWRSPAPDTLSVHFEVRFARLEYVEDDKFNLACTRYSGRWSEIFQDLTLDECIEEIKGDPLLQP